MTLMTIVKELVTEVSKKDAVGAPPPNRHLAISDKCVTCMEATPEWLEADLPGLVKCVPHFRRAEFFARWLFAQLHDEDAPPKTLVVTWREAKPCIKAVAAALSGDTKALRGDRKRLERPVAGALCERTSVPVDKMIVVTEKPSQAKKAEEWAAEVSDLLDVGVARNALELVVLLTPASGDKSGRSTASGSELGSTAPSSEHGEDLMTVQSLHANDPWAKGTEQVVSDPFPALWGPLRANDPWANGTEHVVPDSGLAPDASRAHAMGFLPIAPPPGLEDEIFGGCFSKRPGGIPGLAASRHVPNPEVPMPSRPLLPQRPGRLMAAAVPPPARPPLPQRPSRATLMATTPSCGMPVVPDPVHLGRTGLGPMFVSLGR